MKQQYIVGQQRTILAEQLGLTETQVRDIIKTLTLIRWQKGFG